MGSLTRAGSGLSFLAGFLSFNFGYDDIRSGLSVPGLGHELRAADLSIGAAGIRVPFLCNF